MGNAHSSGLIPGQPLGNAAHALDDYYLAITLLITVAYQLIGFHLAYAFKFDKLTDLWGGSNFVWLAIITLSMSGTTNARPIVTSVFMMIWGARLAGFLLFRILKTGSDDRFDDKRGNYFKFLGFWVFQMFWVWIVSFPVTISNSPRVTIYPQPYFGQATDIVGTIIWALAFLMEAMADIQKYRFKQSSRGQQPGAVCNVGFFKWSRHPNYFAEIMVHVGIFMIAITPAAAGAPWRSIPSFTGAYAALYSSMLGIFFITFLLMFISGLPLQERPGAKKRYEKGVGWPEYERYLQETSILIPMPPAIWRNLPVIVKRTVGLEFPMYVFDPAKHADQSKVQDRQAEEGNGSESGERLN